MGSFWDPDLSFTSFFDPSPIEKARLKISRRRISRGPRYYGQVQCGQSVDPRVYQPRARFGACNEARDVKADIDEDAIMKHLQREARLRGRHGAIRLHD